MIARYHALAAELVPDWPQLRLLRPFPILLWRSKKGRSEITFEPCLATLR